MLATGSLFLFLFTFGLLIRRKLPIYIMKAPMCINDDGKQGGVDIKSLDVATGCPNVTENKCHSGLNVQWTFHAGRNVSWVDIPST
jgi:hypothetical protein